MFRAVAESPAELHHDDAPGEAEADVLIEQVFAPGSEDAGSKNFRERGATSAGVEYPLDRDQPRTAPVEYFPLMDFLRIRGARQHNLRNLDCDIPRNRLVVITGVSGSGKSSLAFDTIFAEGQRRYVESLSAYARQFLEQMEKPDVDSIEGLSPAIESTSGFSICSRN